MDVHGNQSNGVKLAEIVTFCEKVKTEKPNLTLVWKLRDHWSVTERCAVAAGCE
ncbi:hypothetical protein [Salmonella enterica]|uniref:hypothetical protein n=1 Tax=Salmonella enterica TaxID=28901 RepID=UPI00398C2788